MILSVTCILKQPHGLPLFVQTRRWRFGWISTAGQRTRKDKSSSSTRRRASSPRTLWRRSTLRVSAAPRASTWEIESYLEIKAKVVFSFPAPDHTAVYHQLNIQLVALVTCAFRDLFERMFFLHPNVNFASAYSCLKFTIGKTGLLWLLEILESLWIWWQREQESRHRSFLRLNNVKN